MGRVGSSVVGCRMRGLMSVASALALAACGATRAPAPAPVPEPVPARPASDTSVATTPADSARAAPRRATAAMRADSLPVPGTPGSPEIHPLAAMRRAVEPLATLPVLDTREAPEVHVFHGCAGTGTAAATTDGALNVLKNRVDEPADYTPAKFSALTKLTWPPAVQKHRRATWSPADSATVAEHEGAAVMVEGYLAIITDSHGVQSGGVHPEGAETPNCGGTAPGDVDWHVWFNAQPRRNRTRSVVIEFTPRVRAMHPGWTVAKLRQAALDGRRVRASGWLMLDQEHPEQIQPGGGRLATRRTLWEIHPVMTFEVEDDNGEFVPLDDWGP